MGWGNESEYNWFMSHDQNGNHVHNYMIKTFKNCLEWKGWWPGNFLYSIRYSSTTKFVKWWHWVDLDHVYDIVKCFLMLLHGWKLIQRIVIYFQACSKSAYSMHSGKRYRTSGPLVWHLHCKPMELCLGKKSWTIWNFFMKYHGWVYALRTKTFSRVFTGIFFLGQNK